MERHSIFGERFFKEKISRKGFLRMALAGLAALTSSHYLVKLALAQPEASAGRKKRYIKGDCGLAAAKGGDPYRLTQLVVQAMGGMERFVKKGSTVVIKPNIGWDRIPEQAATTNPEVVAALVESCFAAGAKRVNVFDIPCNDPRRCYVNSGVQKAAQEKGAQVYFPDRWNVVKAHFNYPSSMEGWSILRDAVECDTFINVPILKHHSLTHLTISMKNLMGVCIGNRGLIHFEIGRNLVDLTDFISPDLTVIDAFRVLTRHGPSGGNLADVKDLNTVIAATDPTLADSYACQLMGIDPLSVPYINNAVGRKFGSHEIGKAHIKTIGF
jgi:uncharacterized protein (DUF362 family)